MSSPETKHRIPIGLEPAPVLELPFVVAELSGEMEALRAVVFDLVASRAKLLEQIEGCHSVEDLKVMILETYKRTANRDVLEYLKGSAYADDFERKMESFSVNSRIPK